MSIYSNGAEQDLDNLRKLAEQQKNQRAEKITNRVLKQTHEVKLAESLSPITKKLDVINDSTEQLGEIVKKSDVEDGISQRLAIKIITGTQSLRDTSTLMKGSKKFFKLVEQDNGQIFWNKIPIKALGENRISIKNQEYDIKPNFQTYCTNT